MNIIIDAEALHRATRVVRAHDEALQTNPGIGERIYGSDRKMLRQALNDSGFPGITESEAEALAHRIRAAGEDSAEA